MVLEVPLGSVGPAADATSVLSMAEGTPKTSAEAAVTGRVAGLGACEAAPGVS